MKRSDKIHMGVLFALIIILGLLAIKVDVLGILTFVTALGAR